MSTKHDKPTPQELVSEVTTPIFSKEMGERLRLMRMRKVLDQAELGAMLGISQQMVSRLESAQVATIDRPFSVAKLREVFKQDTLFILLGANPERFNPGFITKNYWNKRLKRKGEKATRGSRES